MHTPARPKRIGMVSLGCPKALVDSERILTTLRAEGYDIVPDYDAADAVIVNTCGFLDSAKAESLDAIGEAIAANGKVIVTGCMGVEAERIREAHPKVLAVSGPQAFEQVVSAVHEVAPPEHDPYVDLVPPEGIRLTPRHYAYLKISEGCNHHCSFCIIPDLRGRLVSRKPHHILHEAEKLAEAGCQELLVISQDTSAYGVDLRHETFSYRGRDIRAHVTDLATALGELGIWVRLHYVYPYPHVDQLIELMADGLVLPYLDIPFQHASPRVLKAMRRPAHQDRTLERIRRWREKVPDLALRSTMIVGFPGETEEDFEQLLDWLSQARLERVGCFRYENVEGAAANALDGQVPDEIREERWNRLMELQRRISREKLAERVGTTTDIVIDEVHEDGTAVGRTWAEAPEIDGVVRIEDAGELVPGDLLTAEITGCDDYDLFVSPPD
ncbi:MAG: 30S ribosomal protein S12 methylthiotransferase RimO [Geminicoccaceae bacterium]